jgi:hypothetical protein
MNSYLHIFDAVINNDIFVIQKYLEEGGSPNLDHTNVSKIERPNGFTNLLNEALKYNREEIIALLIDYNVSVNEIYIKEYNKSSINSLLYALDDYNICKMLLEAGADPNQIVIGNHDEFLILELALKNMYRTKTIKLLIKYGANVFVEVKYQNYTFYDYVSDSKNNISIESKNFIKKYYFFVIMSIFNYKQKEDVRLPNELIRHLFTYLFY